MVLATGAYCKRRFPVFAKIFCPWAKINRIKISDMFIEEEHRKKN